MAISIASLNRATAIKPPRILIHGVHGVGKTTFAAGAPDPVFVLTEDGLGTLEVSHFPHPARALLERLAGPLLDQPAALSPPQRTPVDPGILGALVEGGDVELEIRQTERRPAAVYRAVRP